MATISKETLQAYRAKTFRLDPNRKLLTPEDAAAFVKERGFVYFWPIKGITLPSLWSAVGRQSHKVTSIFRYSIPNKFQTTAIPI